MCARSGARARVSPAGRWLNAAVHDRIGAVHRRLDLRVAAGVLADGDATMTQVARRLGVAKPTLYKLARSREELVRACVENETERLLGHLHANEPSPAGVVSAVDAYASESPGGFRLLFERRAPQAEAAVRRVEARLAQLARRGGPRAPGPPGAAPARRPPARAGGGPAG